MIQAYLLTPERYMLYNTYTNEFVKTSPARYRMYSTSYPLKQVMGVAENMTSKTQVLHRAVLVKIEAVE